MRPTHKTTSPDNSAPPLSSDVPSRLYEMMLKCRMVEQRAAQLLSGRESGVNGCGDAYHEAIEAGATIDLKEADAVVSCGRVFAAQVMRGASLPSLFAQLRRAAKEKPAEKNTGGASNVAAQFAVATGLALGCSAQKQQNLVIALSSQAGAPFEAWRETLAFASASKLPILYVIRNSMRGRRKGEDLCVLAQSCNVPGIRVDAHDAVAVYRVCHEARVRARQGYGPTVVECATCETAEPLATLAHYLQKRNQWSNSWKLGMEKSFRQEIREALALSKKTMTSEQHALAGVYSFCS